MNISWKKEWPLWLIIAIPFAVACIYWNQLPDRIPIHWDFNGNPNGWSGKPFGLLFVPVLNIALYFFLLYVPKIDPKKANYDQFKGPYAVIRYVIHALMTAIYTAVTINITTGNQLSLGHNVLLLMPVFIMILGNFLGKIRPNYMVGVRTPWTLANEQVWVKTHRVTGRVWVAASFVFIMLSLAFPMQKWGYYLYLSIIIITPILYSYIAFKKEENKNH